MSAEFSQDCRVCGSNHVQLKLAFGDQPRCFDFQSHFDNEDDIARFPFSITQCETCGVVQQGNVIPPSELVPVYSWIKNKEPTDHASDMAEEVIHAAGSQGRVLFISEFDAEVFDRVSAAIGSRAYLLNQETDLGLRGVEPMQALIQGRITVERCRDLAQQKGHFDLVVSCRLVEHAQSVSNFVNGLRELLTADGHLLLELPDSSKGLIQGDVAMLWEEHTVYFTPESLRTGMARLGFRQKKVCSYFYPQEDALVAWFTKSHGLGGEMNIGGSVDRYLADSFCDNVTTLREDLAPRFKRWGQHRGNIVVFGAGHRAAMFLNLTCCAKYVHKVIDDDPRKRGLYIPGTSIEIVDSSYFCQDTNGVCVMALSIGVEARVADKVREATSGNVSLYSISPDSPYWLGSALMAN